MHLGYATLITVLIIIVLCISVFVPAFSIWENSFSVVALSLLAMLLALELALIYWKRHIYGTVKNPSRAEELLESVRDQFVYALTDFQAQGLPDPSVQKLTLYVDGVESFGEAFTIVSEMGEFSGTCGISVESSYGQATKQSVDMVQVWLAGDDYVRRTIGRFVTSTVEGYKNYENADLIQLIRKGAIISVETGVFYLQARVIDEQTQIIGTHRIIDRIVIELAVWLRIQIPGELEGVNAI